MFSDLYDKIAPTYAEQRISGLMVNDILQSFVKGKTLDIGCGNGALLDIMFIKDYYGIDTSAQMLLELDKKHPEQKIMQCSGDQFLGLITNFDTIVALNGAASYLDSRTYPEIKKHLAPGGKIFLMFYKPNFYPEYYKNRHKKKLDAFKKLVNPYPNIHREFDHVYDWGDYVIATNFVIEQWEKDKYK